MQASAASQSAIAPGASPFAARVREAKGAAPGAIADCAAALAWMGPVDQDRVRPTRETIERLRAKRQASYTRSTTSPSGPGETR